MKYLLSIIIPTRNRQKYALAAALQTYSVTDERVQIVISDNSDDDSLEKDILAQNFSERVVYKYISGRIPGVDNYISGIELSEGEYLCNIGDDDGVMRYITDFVEWAKRHDIKAITPSSSTYYMWPGVLATCPKGRLTIGSIHKSYFEYRSPQDGLIEMIRRGGVECYNLEVAKMYHGVVKRECFEKVKAITGRYCGGLVPDVYLSTAFSLTIEKVLFIAIPLTIPGVCASSESGKTANKKDYGELKDFSYFCGQDYTWSSKIPYFYSSNTIWADSLMHALEDMGANQMVSMFDLESFITSCKELYPEYSEHLETFYSKFNVNMNKQVQLNKQKHTRKASKTLMLLKAKIARRLPLKLKQIIKMMLRINNTARVSPETRESDEATQSLASRPQTEIFKYIEVDDIIKAEKAIFEHIEIDVNEYVEQIKSKVI